LAACSLWPRSRRRSIWGYLTAGVPKTPNGKPNLAALVPRTADGKPDFSGMWGWETGPPCGAKCGDTQICSIALWGGIAGVAI
jgi:hypothetical protein